MISLKDTVKPMLSLNFKDRHVAEYYQLRIRIDSLTEYLRTTDDSVDVSLLIHQLDVMKKYQECLEIRAKHLSIKL